MQSALRGDERLKQRDGRLRQRDERLRRGEEPLRPLDFQTVKKLCDNLVKVAKATSNVAEIIKFPNRFSEFAIIKIEILLKILEEKRD